MYVITTSTTSIKTYFHHLNELNTMTVKIFNSIFIDNFVAYYVSFKTVDREYVLLQKLQ